MEKKRVIIVGGVAGGASCAARLRRLCEDAEITVIEQSHNISFANCGMPYFLGGTVPSFSNLVVTTPESMKARFNIDAIVDAAVTSIDTQVRSVSVLSRDGSRREIPYDALVISTGCRARFPPIPGIHREGHFALRTLEDTSAIEGWIVTRHPKRACVCGGGFIGLEMAEQLHLRGMSVKIVQNTGQVMPPYDQEMADYILEELRANDITVYLPITVTEFAEPEGQPEECALASDVILKDGTRFPADLVILGMGIQPNSGIAVAAGLTTNAQGYIVVNSHMQTSNPYIYAVGDVCEVQRPISGGRWAVALAGPANRQGRIAANHIAGHADSGYRGTYATSVIKIFNITAGCVGMSEAFARHIYQSSDHSEDDIVSVYVHGLSHAGYYPGADTVHLKLVFDKLNGEILGAQGIGKSGVDKRIDVIATAMIGGLRARDLADLELCYAPPYGSARDPVNMIGMIAQNVMDGLVDLVTPRSLIEQASAGRTQDIVLLDVRNADEIARSGTVEIEGLTMQNIPLNDLRAAVHEGSLVGGNGATYVVSCKTGQRAYYASRVLSQLGYRCQVLTGSFETFKLFKKRGLTS